MARQGQESSTGAALKVRQAEVERIRRRLIRRNSPKLHMSVIVALTGSSGFLASWTLLRGGMVTMWSRYLIAFAIAYLVFIALLWLWLRGMATEYARVASLPDEPDIVEYPSLRSTPDRHRGKSSVLESIGDNVDPFDAFDLDDGALPVVAVIALMAGLLVSAFFVIQAAPLLFAELIVDGVLSVGLYRRLRGLSPGFWLTPVLKHTFVPFVLTAILVSAAGWELVRHAPGAHSLRQALHEILR